jgi:predicted negative regulator of RcsB-dependent stress response
MSQLPPANQTPEGTTPVYAPAFETAVQGFWAKNRQGVLVLVVVALLAIVAREAWQYFAASREQGVRADFAKTGDQVAKLESFASTHSGHALAGIAHLRIADDKFSAGDYKNAATAYQKAAGSLKNEALLGRARLGAAISQVNAGDQAAGETALKGVSADATLAKGVRAEATYHLAALAADAGRADDVKKLADEVSKIDATSSWAQRATMLVVRQPGALTKPADATTPTISFKPSGK